MRRVWILLVLAGCASGPMPELAPGVEVAYREFLANPRGVSFAVSEDGRVYGSSICEFDYCWGNGARVAIRQCEARGGRKCVVYR